MKRKKLFLILNWIANEIVKFGTNKYISAENFTIDSNTCTNSCHFFFNLIFYKIVKFLVALYFSYDSYANFKQFRVLNNTMGSIKIIFFSKFSIYKSAWRMFDMYNNYMLFMNDFIFMNNTDLTNGKLSKFG